MARSWDVNIGDKYYKLDDNGNLNIVDNPSNGDVNALTLDDEIPNLKVGRDLHGDILSLNYSGNSDYDSIMESLPSTPLSTVDSNGDIKNKSVGLLDVLKANSKNSVKAIEEQNLLLKANNILQQDVVKNLSLLSASLSSLSSNSNDLHSIEKSSLVSQLMKNKKHTEYLNFETTGKIPIDESNLSLMDKFNGNNSEQLKNSQGEDIIPSREKAKKDAEKSFQLAQENSIDSLKLLEEVEKESVSDDDYDYLVDTLKEVLDFTPDQIKQLDDINKGAS